MPAQVVTETPGQVVDALFFDQTVGCIVGELVRRVVFVDQRGQANRRVVFVADALALGVLATARQAPGGAQQSGGLALAVGVRQHLAESVVGERLGAAIRVMDAQHFAVRLALQRGGLAQRVGDGDQMVALVEAVGGVFTGAILEAFDLGQGVPPQVFGLAGCIDDGVWQAVVAVEVFGFIAQGVDFGDQVALGVIAGLPGAAVQESRFGDQRSAEVVLVFDLATQWIGFFKQTRKVVVLEPQPVAIRQLETGHVAGFVEVDSVLLTAEVAKMDSFNY